MGLETGFEIGFDIAIGIIVDGMQSLHSRPLLWLVLLCIALYASSLGGGFVYDDNHLLAENDRLITASPRLAFTSDFWGSPPQAWLSMHYRPLAMLAYSGIHSIFGLSPFAYHAANIAMHAAATGSFYLLLVALGYGGGIALAASMLFAVHPMHVESVAWMSGLTETMAGAFVLGSLAFFAHGRRRWSWVLAAAAVLTKESALALPGLVLALAYLNCSEDRKWRAAISAAVPYALIDAVYLAARWIVLPRPPREIVLRVFAARWPAIPESAAHYLRWMLCPWPLAIHYELPGRLLVGFAFALAAAWIFLMMNQPTWRDDLALCGALMALPLVAPVLTSPMMPHWLQAQDRYAYVAVAGACLLLALFLDRLPLPGRTLLLACLFLVPLGALGTYLQLSFWQSDETLWTHTLEVTPSSQTAAINLARDMYLEGRFHEAEKVTLEALRYRPEDPELRELLRDLRRLTSP